MYQNSLEDTIAAISTPSGQGGIGIVRVSGKEALSIGDEIFVGVNERKPSEFKTFTLHYGRVINRKGKAEEVVDEVLLTVMRAPKSYTCEDVVEISCHGGTVPLKKILMLTLDHGARLAEPGEFTKRAFLNGRIDLTQAEAVADIISAKTDAFLKLSINQLKGDLTLELESIREYLMDAYTEIEAVVNFPEDDIDASSRKKLSIDIKEALKHVEALLASSEQGRILKEGIKVVICGKVNVGKSSLLNVFLKQPRAIVSHIEGTTRDIIEESAQIQGIPLQLIDTAGILDPRDSIEEEAVKRSHLYIDQAEIILLLFDASQEISQEDINLANRIKDKNVIIVLNKCDCPTKIDEGAFRKLLPNFKMAKISALEKQGINPLEEMIVENALHGKRLETPKILISNLRQIESLKKCLTALEKAQEHFSQNLSLEFISEEIKLAISLLDQITGKDIDNDLIDKIFSSFCVGK
ncbi:MAG: tRNA uridine-5-carboxymethylaminomethyl(34) synthesis GTPase MnmE [Candidatus Aceula meridiana]|nr:tRNA uridine-5-carboxymethylaminomethyl(34) synthesis GTPase MnmE [Candidatus Aceula meridiana]